MALQTVNQFDIGTKFSNLGTGFAQGQQMGGQFQLGGERQAASERVGTEFEQEQSQLRASTINKLAINLSQLPLEQRAASLAQSGDILRSVNVDPTVFEGGDLSDATLGEVIAGTGGVATAAGPSALDQAKTANLTAKTAQIGQPVEQTPIQVLQAKKLEAEIAKLGRSPTNGPAPSLPESLVEGVPPEHQQILKDIFETSGGGVKGIKQVQKQKEVLLENEQRRNAPKILVDLYPKASEEDQKQLQAAVDGGKTIAEGMKEAGKLREKQRQKKKGDGFRQRALDVVNRLLLNDELDDVTGSEDGKDESFIPFGGQKFRGDNESDAIADIKEVGDILTGDNLDIMSGVLSESDIDIIRNLAAGGLIRTRSDKRFRADLEELRTKLSNILSEGKSTSNNVFDNKDLGLLPQGAEKQGGVLNVDANGNKAMVFPDGSFKEL